MRIFNIPKENNIFEFSNKYTNFFFVSFSIYFCRSNERNKIFFKHFSFISRHINYAIILPRTVTLKIRLEYFYILRSLFPSLHPVSIDFSLRHTHRNSIKITNDLAKILRNSIFPLLSSAHDSGNVTIQRNENFLFHLLFSLFRFIFFFFFFFFHSPSVQNSTAVLLLSLCLQEKAISCRSTR